MEVSTLLETYKLNKIETIRIVNFKLRMIPKELFDLNWCKILDLRFNELYNISELKKLLINLKDIKVLYLIGNKFNEKDLIKLKQEFKNCNIIY